MKFALITADTAHKTRFKINGENGDVTSFMQWVDVLNGIHLSFEALRKEDNSYLKNYDLVMMSGHPQYMDDIIRIAKMLKDSDCVSMFYPEGSAQLYDNSINGYQPKYYEAWRACDILSIAEEDKQSYYESFVGNETIVRFIHVPITNPMLNMNFFRPYSEKQRMAVVYGDNNPNHPLIAISAINQYNKKNHPLDVFTIETRGAKFYETFPDLQVRQMGKHSQYSFLRILSRSVVNVYPTEWIGTARHQISCACVGTPCIGNRESHTQKRLFPSLGVNIYDVEGMIYLMEKLVSKPEYYKKIIDFALSQLPFYGLENTLKRLNSAFDQARSKFKKEKVLV